MIILNKFNPFDESLPAECAVCAECAVGDLILSIKKVG